jgi:hypothetical protein
MGELIDRDLQHKLLNQLRDVYPDLLEFKVRKEDVAERANGVNLSYLMEQGLVAGVAEHRHIGDRAKTYSVRITAKGLDFLADDGGLGAILRVVTVRLHDDTIRDLLLARVDADERASEDEKRSLSATIRELPAETLKEVVKEAIKLGLNHVGDLLPWLEHVRAVATHLGVIKG